MSNPVTDAFFFGRALAEVFSEKLEESFTNAMSDLGKFDAEQRENLRKFIEEVETRAVRAAGNSTTSNVGNQSNTTSNNTSSAPVTSVEIDIHSDDLQAMLDSLRAEIATLRAELKKHQK